MYIDSHCHLDRLNLDPYGGDLSAALNAAFDANVSEMLCISIGRDNIERVVAIANEYDNIWASVGIHPCDVDQELMSVEELVAYTQRERVVALGETGLDYYHDTSLIELQKESFINHLKASTLTKKPVVVHTRSARKDTLDIIKHNGDVNVAGVLHCFTEDWAMAKAALEMNYYISFSGIVTFKNAQDLRDTASKVPLDRILIETDSPYLAPTPYRGKSNEPKYVTEVAKCIAELRGLSIEALAEQTSHNFKTLFSFAK